MTDELNPKTTDLVCFSHLRWNFVFQRPQHLMSRFAKGRRVFFFEEPVFEGKAQPALRLDSCEKTGVLVCTPVLSTELAPEKIQPAVKTLLNRMFRSHSITDHVQWFYTPMALEYCPPVQPLAVVYDCMDELSLFRQAPPSLQQNEKKLFSFCDLVFTGGFSLFEAKRQQHERVYPFPSSVDASHFLKARTLPDTAPEQMHLPKPRLGYTGVIDERIDLKLIREMAEQRPEWQFVMVGPVVKIDPASLPQLPNIHWLGGKNYSDLPKYLAGWDIALMPFELNDATRFISPTKTPEYLAAGLPVISTAIRDVVRQYGQTGMAHIASGSAEFIAAAEDILARGRSLKVLHRIDDFLRTMSWDRTWAAMDDLINEKIASNAAAKLGLQADQQPNIPGSTITESPKTMTAGQGGVGYV